MITRIFGNSIRVLALVAALSPVAGCAKFDAWLQNDVINPTVGTLQNPNTQVLIADLKVTATALSQAATELSCIIDAGTTVAGAIEANPAFKAGASTQGTNLKINVASTAACTTLQGVLAGNVSVPAGGTVIDAAPAS